MKVKITGKTGKKYVRLTFLVNTTNGYQNNETRIVTATTRTIIRKNSNGAQLVTRHYFPGAFMCFTWFSRVVSCALHNDVSSAHNPTVEYILSSSTRVRGWNWSIRKWNSVANINCVTMKLKFKPGQPAQRTCFQLLWQTRCPCDAVGTTFCHMYLWHMTLNIRNPHLCVLHQLQATNMSFTTSSTGTEPYNNWSPEPGRTCPIHGTS